MLLAPLLLGWVNQMRAWLSNRKGPGVLQPYRMLHKLFNKDSVMADTASSLFRFAPYAVFASMLLANAIIPTLSTDLPLASAADAIALVGLFALARIFISLAAMDIGTAFGTLGARREMLVGFLAEPALLTVLFSASLIGQSTALTTIVEAVIHKHFAIYPSLVFAGMAFILVFLAENARVPVDNPATHLELTMIHEAMILEYSGRHLALMEWAATHLIRPRRGGWLDPASCDNPITIGPGVSGGTAAVGAGAEHRPNARRPIGQRGDLVELSRGRCGSQAAARPVCGRVRPPAPHPELPHRPPATAGLGAVRVGSVHGPFGRRADPGRPARKDGPRLGSGRCQRTWPRAKSGRLVGAGWTPRAYDN